MTRRLLCALALLACATPVRAERYTVTDLGTLGGNASQALAINDSGQVVGWAITTAGSVHAFLYANGAMKDIGAFTARGINDAGQVVGYKGGSRGAPSQAFMYANGKV